MVTSGPERQHSGEGACLACYHGNFQALAEDIHEPHQVTGEGKKVTLSGGKDLEKDGDVLQVAQGTSREFDPRMTLFL